MTPTKTATDEAETAETVEEPAVGPGYYELYRKLFGIGDLHGMERHLAELNLRDARSRVTAVPNEAGAMDVLAAAERHGDESLARAIASKGYMLGWPALLAAWIEARPDLAHHLAALRQTPAPVPPAMPAAGVVTQQQGIPDRIISIAGQHPLELRMSGQRSDGLVRR